MVMITQHMGGGRRLGFRQFWLQEATDVAICWLRFTHSKYLNKVQVHELGYESRAKVTLMCSARRILILKPKLVHLLVAECREYNVTNQKVNSTKSAGGKLLQRRLQ